MARIRLHLNGIRINDGDNGAWMIHHKKHKGHWTALSANTHLEIHTHNYEGWIRRILQSAQSEAFARSKLQVVARMLENGTQPKEVTRQPDSSWQSSL